MLLLSAVTGAEHLKQDNPSVIKLSSTLWSDLRDIRFQGSNAYCLFFDGLTILDLSNINSPSQAGQIELPQDGRKVTVWGNHAYVTSSDSLLHIIDISSVSNPLLMGSFKMPDVFTDLEAKDNCIYASARDAGLVVVDVTDPFNAAVIGSCQVEGFQALSLCLRGNLAYTAGIGGLKLINILIPRFPYLFGSSDVVPAANRVFVGKKDGTVYAYLGNPWQFSVLNVTNPRNILPVSVYTPASDIVDLTVSGHYAYLGLGYEELVVLDLEEEESPQKVATLRMGDYTSGVYSFSDFLFVSDIFGPAKIVNVFNPHRPFVTGKWIVPGTPEAVVVKDKIAYLACRNSGLHILNLTNPTDPQIVSTLWAPYDNNYIDIEGSYAYLTALLAGMRIVDISDLSSPTAVSQYNPEGYTYGVEVQDGFAYLRNSGNDIQIIDVQDPLSPIPKGSIQTPGSPKKMVVQGDYLYVADSDSGLIIVNVSDKDTPNVTSTFPTAGDCINVFSADTLLFLVCEDIGVLICDLSVEEMPESLGTYSASQQIEDIHVEGYYAYLSVENQGVEVIDISSPSAPFFVAGYSGVDNPGSLTAKDELIYLCDGRSFKILRFSTTSSIPQLKAKKISTGD